MIKQQMNVAVNVAFL